MIDVGSGPPLVLIPGLDGHCEWLRPAIDELARELRVITFSLHGERGASSRSERGTRAGARRSSDLSRFEADCAQVTESLDRARVERAVIVGVSYGGWVALHYAARHPARAIGLALVSTPPPDFVPTPQQARYLRSPRLSAPAFVLTSPARLGPEVRAAIPAWRDRMRFSAGHLARALSTGISPTRMAGRMHLATQVDFAAACRQIAVPTLIVTGQPGLDRVVPVEQTQRYAALILHAEFTTMPRTGHMGLLTRPDIFRQAIAPFVRRVHGA